MQISHAHSRKFTVNYSENEFTVIYREFTVNYREFMVTYREHVFTVIYR